MSRKAADQCECDTLRDDLRRIKSVVGGYRVAVESLGQALAAANERHGHLMAVVKFLEDAVAGKKP